MTKKLPNIVLIVMDTMGAKHMSLYGYHPYHNLERITQGLGFGAPRYHELQTDVDTRSSV